MGEGGGARGNGGEKHKSLGMGKGVGKGKWRGGSFERGRRHREYYSDVCSFVWKKDLSNASGYTVWKWDAL